MKTRKPKSTVQGEGDYEAASRFNTAERAFVESGKVTQSAGNAAPKSKRDAEEMLNAEAKGKSRAKGQGSLISAKRKTNE